LLYDFKTLLLKDFSFKLSQISFTFLPPKSNVFHNCIMIIHNFWAMDQKGYYAFCCLWMEMEGRGLSMDENWPAGDNMVINPHVSVGRIHLHDITTTISAASKAFQNAHFWKCVIVC